MSTFSKILEAIKRLARKTESTEKPSYGIPTVKFDSSQVTDTIKAEIRKNVESIKGVSSEYFDQIYEVTLRSVSGGRDLFLFTNSLMQMNIEGITKERAALIATDQTNKAHAMMERIRQQSLGFTEAIWMYSGAPCGTNPKKPGRLDTAHKAANGKRYKVAKGMYLNKKWTWPGYEEGCRCVCKVVNPWIE